MKNHDRQRANRGFLYKTYTIFKPRNTSSSSTARRTQFLCGIANRVDASQSVRQRLCYITEDKKISSLCEDIFIDTYSTFLTTYTLTSPYNQLDYTSYHTHSPNHCHHNQPDMKYNFHLTHRRHYYYRTSCLSYTRSMTCNTYYMLRTNNIPHQHTMMMSYNFPATQLLLMDK